MEGNGYLMSNGVPIPVFIGVMDLLSEECGSRMTCEGFNGFLPALQKLTEIWESLPKDECEMDNFTRLSQAERLLLRAYEVVPETTGYGELRQLIGEAIRLCELLSEETECDN